MPKGLLSPDRPALDGLSPLSAPGEYPVTLAELLTEPEPLNARRVPSRISDCLHRMGCGLRPLARSGSVFPDVEARSRELGGGGSPVAAALMQSLNDTIFKYTCSAAVRLIFAASSGADRVQVILTARSCHPSRGAGFGRLQSPAMPSAL
jgi:hypothetical protein